jgi:hypothetical protein
MYITCQIGFKLEIGQTRLKSVKSDWFYEFDWIWPISSFNPQKLKNLLPPCPSPLTLHHIVPTPSLPFPRCLNLKFSILAD